MKRLLFLYAAVAGLVIWNLSLEMRMSSHERGIEPPLDLHVAERDSLDDGYSREYGFYMRPFCKFWSDAHVHASFASLPQEERNREFRMLADYMSELGIVNSAVYCKSETDLAFIDSLKAFAPVWYVEINDPDINKLRRFHQQYHIRAVKLHNSPIFWGEAAGDSMEFPAGSGTRKPISVEWIVSPEWMRFYAVCDSLGLPLTWHTNNRYGPSPYNFGGDNSKAWNSLSYDNYYVLSLIERILLNYPRLRIMLCHQGFLGYTLLGKMLEKHPNLYTDTSAGFLLHDGDSLTDEELERIRPFFIRWSDRILFGSDANAFWDEPQIITESVVRRHIYDHLWPFKRFIQQLRLPQQELSRVAHVNFEKFYGMAPAEDWFY